VCKFLPKKKKCCDRFHSLGMLQVSSASHREKLVSGVRWRALLPTGRLCVSAEDALLKARVECFTRR
jgi:hypothetical protein